MNVVRYLDIGWVRWSTAGFFACCIYAAYLFVPVQFSIPEKKHMTPASFRYMPTRTAKEQGSLASIWSPVLFSLPSAVGFSRPLWDDSTLIHPPAHLQTVSPAQEERFLSPPGVAALQGVDVQEEARDWLYAFEVAQPDSSRMLPQKERMDLSVRFVSHSEPSPDWQLHVPKSLKSRSENWFASIVFRINENGLISSVWIERAAGLSPAERIDLVRAVRSMRVQPSWGGAGEHRVIIKQEGVWQ